MKVKNPFLDLTKFEMVLWSISSFTVVMTSVLSGSGILNALTSFVGVTALIFVAKGYVFGQVLTIVFAVFYGIISFYFKYYGELITYMFMSAPIAAVTVVEWIRHPYKGSKEVEISRLTAKRIATLIVSTVAVTVAFYFILGALGNANLLFSTLSVATSFVASYLTYCRSPYYAIGYSANDIVLIVLWILASIENITYLPMVACFVMFLINDLYGFVNWRRMQKRQEE